jgi:alkanesulfonate monooxygenase SsuD/methylene tetrahydromethanopterin reductase-like flavin-dependent oxidoreductase (luciferase family)
MLKFGVTILPDPPYTRFLELTRLAEQAGFDQVWTYDSHILWQEGYPLLSVAADRTERVLLGHCVTNPGIREPTVTASSYATLQAISGGRMAMGIGRGDSSRRVAGLEPVAMGEFERALKMIKPFMNGEKVQWNGGEHEHGWAGLLNTTHSPRDYAA